MGSYRNGRLIARSVMPPEAWAQIQEFGIFDEPIQVVLVARAGASGPAVPALRHGSAARGRRRGGRGGAWASSVPGSSYEAEVEEEGEEDSEEDEPARGSDPAGSHRALRARPGAPREPAARGGGRAEEDHRWEYVGDGGPGAGGSAGAVDARTRYTNIPARNRQILASRSSRNPCVMNTSTAASVCGALTPQTPPASSRLRNPPARTPAPPDCRASAACWRTPATRHSRRDRRWRSSG